MNFLRRGDAGASILDAVAQPDGSRQNCAVVVRTPAWPTSADTIIDAGGRDLRVPNPHLLVHASVTTEPFGQVILQGMAAGVPIVAACAGGPAEILRHEVTGLLYAPNDVHELAGAMRRMRDPQLRERLSAAARADLGSHSPTVVAAELQRLYARVAERARRRR